VAKKDIQIGLSCFENASLFQQLRMASEKPPGARAAEGARSSLSPARAKSPTKDSLSSPGSARTSAAPPRSPQAVTNGPARTPNPQSGTRAGEASARSPSSAAMQSPPGSPQTSTVKLNLMAKKSTSPGITSNTSSTITTRTVRSDAVKVNVGSASSEEIEFNYGSSSNRRYVESSSTESSSRRPVTGIETRGEEGTSPNKRPISARQVAPSGRPGSASPQSGATKSTTFVARRSPQESEPDSQMLGPASQTTPQSATSSTRIVTKVTSSTSEARRVSLSPPRAATKTTTSTSEATTGIVRSETTSKAGSTVTNVSRASSGTSSAAAAKGSGVTLQSTKAQVPSPTPQTESTLDTGKTTAKRRTVVSFAEPESGEGEMGEHASDASESVQFSATAPVKSLRDRRPTGAQASDKRQQSISSKDEESTERSTVRSTAASNGSEKQVLRGQATAGPKAAVKSASGAPTGPELDDQFQAKKNALLLKFKERAGLPFPKPAEEEDNENGLDEKERGSPEEKTEVVEPQVPVSRPARSLSVIAEETPRTMAAVGVTPKELVAQEGLASERVGPRAEAPAKKALLAGANERKMAAAGRTTSEGPSERSFMQNGAQEESEAFQKGRQDSMEVRAVSKLIKEIETSICRRVAGFYLLIAVWCSAEISRVNALLGETRVAQTFFSLLLLKLATFVLTPSQVLRGRHFIESS
jgi:hypothetical protein